VLPSERGLLERFDKVIEQKGYGSRSEAIRDLVRDHFVDEVIESNQEI
jgi:CopG family transcriptional regulator, nickel-responsive regulator